MNAPSSGPTATLVRLTGPGALGLLHRVTTQKLDDLAPGEARATLVCDFRGRLLRRAIVAVAGDAVWLVADDAPGAGLAQLIDKQIFRERIQVQDHSAAHTVAAVPGGFGGVAGRFLEQDGVPSRIEADASWGYAIDAPPSADAATIERARIAAGRPRHGHEIHEAFNPFEVGLALDVHLNKGCFTGQEALLRMMTYGGVRRSLHAVAGDGAPPDAHAPLRASDATGGVVTSAIADGGGWVGLAVIRRDANPAELRLADGRALARCEAFPERRPLGLPEPAR